MFNRFAAALGEISACRQRAVGCGRPSPPRLPTAASAEPACLDGERQPRVNELRRGAIPR
ncbi:hypothetical protein D9M68_293020 [compost metagenome]